MGPAFGWPGVRSFFFGYVDGKSWRCLRCSRSREGKGLGGREGGQAGGLLFLWIVRMSCVMLLLLLLLLLLLGKRAFGKRGGAGPVYSSLLSRGGMSRNHYSEIMSSSLSSPSCL